jgi:copper-containing nitrite reductase/amicyanin
MGFKLNNPVWIAATWIITLLVGFQLAGTREHAYAGMAVGQRPPLVLEPKASLQTEAGQWTFAPKVPPPIRRSEQRRVVVNWSIKETQSDIAPGVIYDDYWGFEGKVPGPLLRVREGDLVEIHLTNSLNSTHSHNIDFHFVSGPGGGASALNVAPGQTAILEARAMMPGFYMFHCASPDIPVHIANGMYGFVLVEPAEGLPVVGKEFFVVQSEIYAHNGDKGRQSFDIERGERMDPQYVVFNGAVGSMLNNKAPHVPLNTSLRFYIGNAGPNLVSSFHVIGQIFDNVYREGDLLSPPAHGLQTTIVPAGGSTIVEFTPRVPGTFLLVDHSIFRLHRGAAASLVVDGSKEAAKEIYNPISASGQPEMSADSHLSRDMNRSAAHHEMAQSSSPTPELKTASYRVSDIPPASDPNQPLAAIPVADIAPPAAPAAPGNTIQMLPGAGNYNAPDTYGPKSLTVKRGATVTWLNADPNMVHNLVSDKGDFQSPLMRTDQTWSRKFDKPGVYSYHCLPHPWMKGKIVVK